MEVQSDFQWEWNGVHLLGNQSGLQLEGRWELLWDFRKGYL